MLFLTKLQSISGVSWNHQKWDQGPSRDDDHCTCSYLCSEGFEAKKEGCQSSMSNWQALKAWLSKLENKFGCLYEWLFATSVYSLIQTFTSLWALHSMHIYNKCKTQTKCNFLLLFQMAILWPGLTSVYSTQWTHVDINSPATIKLWIQWKLDGVGPVDNRLSTS